jgi:hypothetical protein
MKEGRRETEARQRRKEEGHKEKARTGRRDTTHTPTANYANKDGRKDRHKEKVRMDK